MSSALNGERVDNRLITHIAELWLLAPRANQRRALRDLSDPSHYSLHGCVRQFTIHRFQERFHPFYDLFQNRRASVAFRSDNCPRKREYYPKGVQVGSGPPGVGGSAGVAVGVGKGVGVSGMGVGCGNHVGVGVGSTTFRLRTKYSS